MNNNSLPNVFDINKLESELNEVIDQKHLAKYSPPPRREEVREKESVSEADVGRLSAEAVSAHHAAAAEALELLGQELKTSMERIAQITIEAAAAFDFIRETAEAYRADGKKVADKIEKSAGIIKEVQEAVAALRKKITP